MDHLDPLTIWTAIGIVAAQVVQFIHLSTMIEKRFTALEIHVAYLKEQLAALAPRNGN